jgi:NAD(P)-dependent dehydrogenase (short-subunit alcohol dehydrogenase family)
METILITGASSGMGREMAIRFSASYRVIVNGRNLERLEETVSKCQQSSQQLIWQYDLANVDELETSFTSFLKDNDVLMDYFVHCAGMMKNYPLKMVNLELLQQTFNTNVFSAELITKMLVNKKLNNGALKSIVYISSNISGFGAKAHSVYGASKGALDAMMKSLAMELAPGIRVNSVLPGAVRTALTEHIFEDEDLINRMKDTYPLGIGTTTDIYEAVKFLLSDEARWITGQQITVDGGRTVNITG